MVFKKLSNLLLLTAAALLPQTAIAQVSQYGQWQLVGYSGVSAMHAILAPKTNKVIFIERVELNTQAFLPDGKFAYSTEYDFDTNHFRSLTTVTNTFCSAGGYLPDGTVVNLGGAEPKKSIGAGYNSVRFFKPCTDQTCDWNDTPANRLFVGRWYPTVEALSDGSLFILGGSNQSSAVNDPIVNVPSYEFWPPRGNAVVPFQFMVETLPYNLYPIMHLLPDGNMYIFCNNRSVVLDTTSWQITKRLPDIPGPGRNYPLTAGSILLPLSPANNYQPEILLCGGSPAVSALSKADATCGRIRPLDPNPTWEMDTMGLGRVMPDMTFLADGSVFVVNGCSTGIAGWGKGDDPAFQPMLYSASKPLGKRFSSLNPSVIPRLYHSVAMTVPSGKVMVTGSNPNISPNYTGPFPTDFRVEMFSPPFLFGNPQPIITEASGSVAYGSTFTVGLCSFQGANSVITAGLLNSGFVTHSTHMSQRYIMLQVGGRTADHVTIQTPPSSKIAPPGYYQLFIMENGTPSKSVWIQLTN